MKIEAVDVRRRASAAEIVFEALRAAIVDGSLPDGSPLRQDEIAQMFNTSRIPVREALARLEAEGLVKSERYKGATVSGIAPEDVAEMFSFRSMIEKLVIEAAVPKLTADHLEQAEKHLAAFDASENPAEWGTINRAFHQALYEASGLSYHLTVIGWTLDRLDRYLRAQLSLTDGRKKASDEHRLILDACRAGDAKRAGDLTEKHVEGAKSSLIAYLEERRSGSET